MKEEVFEPGVSRLEELKNKQARALLIGTYETGKDKPLCMEFLRELSALSDTYGVIPVEQMPCPLRQIVSATYLGKGKIEEIKEMCEKLQIDVVIFDDEISPHQQRNIEEALNRAVIDRTELIIGVFCKHAKTKEAKLQVELAQTQYQMPRLKRMWTHLGRQRTGGSSGGYLKGAGETQIEMDRQTLKRKITMLLRQLEEVKKQRLTMRAQRMRSAIPSFAIVGYTNVGKSTLLKAFTNADILIEDKLFATLDTTTRKYTLPGNREIVLIDTVGFIRKIPHTLVSAFRSTLEEALEADILIHVIDISQPEAFNQAEAVMEVLKELNALDRPIITCFNKSDAISPQAQLARLKLTFPKTVLISALKKNGLEDLQEKMAKEINNLRSHMKLKFLQSDYAQVSFLMKEGCVVSSEYEGNNIIIDAMVPKEMAARFAAYEY